MTNPDKHPRGSEVQPAGRPLWRWLAVALLFGLALWLGLWALQRAGHRPKLSAGKAAGFAVAATACALLGLALLARLRDAGLAALVLGDAGMLVAVLLGAGQSGVRLNLLVPGGLFVASLILATFVIGLAAHRRLSLGVGVQTVYLAALLIYAGSLGKSLPTPTWIGLCLGAAVATLGHLIYAGGPGLRPWDRLTRLSLRGQAVVVFLAALAGFVAAAGPRLRGPSANNHFVYLARCYLDGHLKLSAAQLARKTKARQYDDWARVEKVRLRRDLRTRGGVLKAGTVLRGAWLMANRRRTDRFRTTRGRVIALPWGAWSGAGNDWYVSFPPVPAVLMAPGVAVWGYRFNDVWFSVVLAAFSPMLLFLLLGRLRRCGLSERRLGDDLWLTLLFAFGTVNYFVSVRGEVWFTAHVVGVLFLMLYLHASLEARYPLWAGLALGLALGSRVTLLLAVPLFAWELWRRHGGNWRRMVVPALKFGVPVVAIGLLLMWHNAARFDSPFEFGHRYLDIYWKDRIQRWGLFDVHYLSRNLAAAFATLPHLQPESPYFLISRHGLSLWLVSPALLLVVWPRLRGPWHRPLWLAVASMAGLVLLYQNSGFVQFSYRFSLDFTPLLVLLIALGGRRLSTPVKVLILWGILWHLLGAVTFGIAPEFYGRTNWVWTPLDPNCAC